MGSEWPESTLEELSKTVSYGYTESASSEMVGPHFLRITDIQNGVVNWSNVPYCPISENDHIKYKLKDGDIVVARTGNSTGENYIFSGTYDAVFASYLIRFRIDETKSNPKYVWYTMRSAQWWEFVNRSKTGSAQAGANAKILGRFPVSLPPLSEQNAIAHILGSLDDKIELNRRMNETLEEMAQALFKSWFVDFDPVIDNALEAGNSIPEKLTKRTEIRRKALADGTANREVAKQFPSTFQFTEEMGWIPEGWEAAPLNQTIQINPTVKLSKGTIAPYVDMKALPTDGYIIDSVIEKAYSGGAKFQNNDVLLARITPCLENGKTGIVDFLPIPNNVGFGSTEFIVLRGKGELSLFYVACLAREEKFRLHCIQSMVGTSGRQRVQNSCFDSFHIARPTNSTVLKKFSEIAQPMFKKVTEQAKGSRTLTNLRDTLLPKLISGELRVSDAENLVEESL
jgi:type I restriction enzyme S subunit